MVLLQNTFQQDTNGFFSISVQKIKQTAKMNMACLFYLKRLSLRTPYTKHIITLLIPTN